MQEGQDEEESETELPSNTPPSPPPQPKKGSKCSKPSHHKGIISSFCPSSDEAVSHLFSVPMELNSPQSQSSHNHPSVTSAVSDHLAGRVVANERGSLSRSVSVTGDNDGCIRQGMGRPFPVFRHTEHIGLLEAPNN